MNINLFLSICLGKTIIFAIKLLKIGGGSAAPGYYALKLYPDLVSQLAKQIPKTIVITGTNGKTTTARLLSQFAETEKLRIVKNATGSNLERGIASALISAYHLRGGKLDIDLAILELDEAAFNTVIPKLNPDLIIFLNVFRDQLDRYGEVDSIVKKWEATLKNVNKNCTLLINGDDLNLLGMKKQFKGKTFTFGVENYKIRGEVNFKKIGDEKLDLEAKNVNLLGLDGVKFELDEKDGLWHFLLPVPGIYHVYDFLAAYIAALKLGIERKSIIKALQTFSPAFGRVEKFQITPSNEAYIFLIKNPVGANQVFEVLKGELKPKDILLLALNDKFADGTDVSWIWDAEFEKLKVQSEKLKIIVSGTRADDLSLRLKYADFEPEPIIIENNLQTALQEAKKGLEGRLFILPTYTALLELQKILANSGLKKEYWKEGEIKN